MSKKAEVKPLRFAPCPEGPVAVLRGDCVVAKISSKGNKLFVESVGQNLVVYPEQWFVGVADICEIREVPVFLSERTSRRPPRPGTRRRS